MQLNCCIFLAIQDHFPFSGQKQREENLNHKVHLCCFPLMLYVADVTISQQEVTDFFYPIVRQFSFPIAISYPCKACAGGSV